MTLSRRDFLRLSGLVAAGVAASACSPIVTKFAAHPLGGKPPISDDGFRALNRLTFGATVAERLRVDQIGVAAWIEEQLAPDLIDDLPTTLRLKKFSTLNLKANELLDWSDKIFGEHDRLTVPDELAQATLTRQVFSQRQLYEVMVEFWNDHFNISIEKGDCRYLKTFDDREVIRKNALGNFRDLLWASSHSSAMLICLDNQVNRKGAPNENYAREIMELHSLGVKSGYSQKDVMELARCLTGWSVKEHWWRGDFLFDEKQHDEGTKHVLGLEIKPNGQGEAEQVIEVLAAHPATAKFIATKLARRFIADQPPVDLINRAAEAFIRSEGDIKTTLRVILFDGISQLQPKYKRPVNYLTSSLRMLNADTISKEVLEYLALMGQPYFAWPTPDGYPDRSEAWQGNLMPRWQFAFALAQNEIKDVKIDLIDIMKTLGAKTPTEIVDGASNLLLGAKLNQRDTLTSAIQKAGATEKELAAIIIGGILASPAFQWR